LSWVKTPPTAILLLAMVSAVAVMPNNKIAVGGVFTQLNTGLFNTYTRSHLALLATNGVVDTFFNPPSALDAAAYALLPQGSRLFVAGGVTTPVAGIARARADGSLDVSFYPGQGVSGNVFCVATQADGQVLIGGSFTAVDGQPHFGLARLGSGGGLDGSFNAKVTGGSVFALAVQSDGKIVLGGDFTGVNGNAAAYLARMDAAGALEPLFAPGVDGPVYSLALDEAGRILMGGNFTSLTGAVRNRIARLLPTGVIDTNFDPGQGANDAVHTLTLLPDGRIAIGGDFTEVDGLARGHVALLNSDPQRPVIQPLEAPVAGVLTLVATVAPGQTCVLDLSTDFVTWSPVATNAALAGTVTFSVTTGTAPGGGFYRVRYGP
jgi:uncharacterized delta-60 repeat protein